MWEFEPDCEIQLKEQGTGLQKKIKSAECKVLLLLLENQDEVVLKEELITRSWENKVVSDSSLTQVIAQLRLALGDNGRDQNVIRNAPREGYKLISGHVCLSENYLKRKAKPAQQNRLIIHTDKNNEEINRENYNKFPYLFFSDKFFLSRALTIILILLSTLAFIWSGLFYLKSDSVSRQVWINKNSNGINYYIKSNMASREVYNAISSHVPPTVSKIFISKGTGQLYLSCIYLSSKYKERQIYNITIIGELPVDQITKTIIDNCS